MASNSTNTCPKCGNQIHEGATSCAACGAHWGQQHIVTTDDPYLGKIIEDLFEVESIIGNGSMGIVYKAKHLSYGIHVALKVLRKELLNNREAVTRFDREAKIASEIDHPNVIRIYHYGKTFLGVPYFAMDCLEGNELASLVAQQFPLDQRRICKICIQIARALEAVHAAGIVHQDLKPANLIVVEEDGEERVKLLDFGIARTPDGEGETRNVEDNAVGTPAFMSPEQVAKQGGVTFSSDLFSLGGVLYYMLTCRLPFLGEEVADITTSILTEDPMLPSQARLDAYVDPQLEQICMKALEKNPANRYASASEMLQALETALPLIAEVAPQKKAKIVVGTPVEADLSGETRFLMAAYADEPEEEVDGGTIVNMRAMDVAPGEKTCISGVSIEERMDDIIEKSNSMNIAIAIAVGSIVIGGLVVMLYFIFGSHQDSSSDLDDDSDVLVAGTSSDLDAMEIDSAIDRMMESVSFGAAMGVIDELSQDPDSDDELEQDNDSSDTGRKRRTHHHRSRTPNALNTPNANNENVEEEEEEEEAVNWRVIIQDRIKKAQSHEKKGRKSDACNIYRSLVQNDSLTKEERSLVTNKLKTCPVMPKKIEF